MWVSQDDRPLLGLLSPLGAPLLPLCRVLQAGFWDCFASTQGCVVVAVPTVVAGLSLSWTLAWGGSSHICCSGGRHWEHQYASSRLLRSLQLWW